MKKSLALLLIAALGTTAVTVSAPASAAKKVAKKAAAKQDTSPGHSPEPDITSATATDFNCELGDKVTTYQSVDDNDHLTLRWQKHLHPLTRVGTTTGANRFEDSVHGLVWIGIPTKSMLLDSKTGHQLANECVAPSQAVTKATTPSGTTAG